MLFTWATNLLYVVSLKALSFTTSLSLLKSTGTGTGIYWYLIFLLLFLKWLISSPNGSYGLGKFWLIFIQWNCNRLNYTKSFLSIQLLNELSQPFHLTNNLSPFFLITFFILNSCWLVFCSSFSKNVPIISWPFKSLITFSHGTWTHWLQKLLQTKVVCIL